MVSTKPAPHPLRRMETLEETLDSHSGYTGSARWMIPYADFLTLLLGFFIIFFAMIKMENTQLKDEAIKTQKELAAAQQEVKELKKYRVLVGAMDPAQLIQAKSLFRQSKPEDLKNASVTLEELEASLAQDLNLKGQQVTVSQDSRGLVISFQERIFFEPGEATLSPQAQTALNKLARVLQNANHPIRVEGHTDDSPIQTSVYPSNWELSTARATQIVRSLVEKHHLMPQKLSAAGYGEFYPLADNSTIEGKQKNRRVDIVLLNPLSDLSSENEGGLQAPQGNKPAKE